MKMKRFIAALLMFSLLLPFSGCARDESSYPPPMELSDTMPPAPDEDGEMDSFEASLYFLSSDKKDFKIETRTVYYGGEITRAEAIVNALKDGPSNIATERSIPVWLDITRIEKSGDVCSVFCEGIYLFDDETWLKLRASVAASLMATEDIKTVNVRYFEAERSIYGYPLGSAEAPEDLSLYVRSMKNTYSSYRSFGSGVAIDDDTEYLTQTATLYFPVSGEDTLLVARGVEITYPERITTSELAQLLIDTLKEGDPEQEYGVPLPADLTLVCPPIVTYSNMTETGGSGSDGPCAIEIVMEPLQEGYDENALTGVLTMTLAGFIPNVTGVKVSFGEIVEADPETQEDEEDDEQELQQKVKITKTLGDKFYTLKDFAGNIGDIAYIYLPDATGNILFALIHLVPWEIVYDPLARLEELFGDSAEIGTPFNVFTVDDVKSVYVVDGIAVVDWKKGFTEKFRAYLEGDHPIARERRESMLVYSIVNTLTDIPEISSVWMLEDGQKLGTVENIYLGNKLVRNPGLIVEKE